MAKKTTIPLDEMPEMAAALGRLLGHFAVLESELQDILGFLLGVNQPRAQIVYMSFVSLRGKLDLIKRLAYNFLDETPGRSKLIELVALAEDLNASRNGLIHATWAVGDSAINLTRLPAALHVKNGSRFKGADKVSATDIQALVDRCAEWTAACQALRIDVLPKLQMHHVPPSWKAGSTGK